MSSRDFSRGGIGQCAVRRRPEDASGAETLACEFAFPPDKVKSRADSADSFTPRVMTVP